TYDSKLGLTLALRLPPRAQTRPRNPGGRIRWSTPVLVLPVADVRGLRAAQLTIDGRDRPLEQGPGVAGVGAGVHAKLPDLPDAAPLAVSLDLTLAGMESLAIVPTARANDATLAST